MKSRSRVHMLIVAAARLEQDRANPKLVADIKLAAKHEADRKVEGRDWNDAEERRVGRQRTLMAMVPDTRAKDSLKEAMLQHAYDLMWEGNCAGADAITEFLPSLEVEKMFDAWQSDQEGKNQHSRFYDAKEIAA